MPHARPLPSPRIVRSQYERLPAPIVHLQDHTASGSGLPALSGQEPVQIGATGCGLVENGGELHGAPNAPVRYDTLAHPQRFGERGVGLDAEDFFQPG